MDREKGSSSVLHHLIEDVGSAIDEIDRVVAITNWSPLSVALRRDNVHAIWTPYHGCIHSAHESPCARIYESFIFAAPFTTSRDSWHEPDRV